MKRFLAGAALGCLSQALLAQTALPGAGADIHLGVKSCADGACHGAAEASPFAAVQQDEYRVWRTQDAHAKAFSVLAGAEAAGIVRRLGLGPAQQQPECLGCHTDNVPANRRGKLFSLTDGVGCEACHGGSERWLGEHSRGRPHAQNVREGMFPVEEPRERARLCLSCHAGSAERPFTHRLLGAGHPRLVLELDTFTLARPAHHVEDADYRTRKPGGSAVRTWAIGQAQAALHWLHLARGKAGGEGLFPEFSLFECYGCHRGMNADVIEKDIRSPALALGAAAGVSQKALGSPALALGAAEGGKRGGQPRLDTSALHMLALVAQRLAPEVAADLQKRIGTLERAPDRAALNAQLAALKPLAEQAALACENHRFSDADARAWLDRFFAGAAAGEFARHGLAEQATYAVGTLTAALQEANVIARSRAVDAALTALYDAVDDGSRFDATRFQSASRALAKLVGK